MGKLYVYIISLYLQLLVHQKIIYLEELEEVSFPNSYIFKSNQRNNNRYSGRSKKKLSAEAVHEKLIAVLCLLVLLGDNPSSGAQFHKDYFEELPRFPDFFVTFRILSSNECFKEIWRELIFHLTLGTFYPLY